MAAVAFGAALAFAGAAVRIDGEINFASDDGANNENCWDEQQKHTFLPCLQFRHGIRKREGREDGE